MALNLNRLVYQGPAKIRVEIQEPQTDGRKHQSGLGFKGWQSKLSLHGDGFNGKKKNIICFATQGENGRKGRDQTLSTRVGATRNTWNKEEEA